MKTFGSLSMTLKLQVKTLKFATERLCCAGVSLKGRSLATRVSGLAACTALISFSTKSRLSLMTQPLRHPEVRVLLLQCDCASLHGAAQV